MKPNFNMPAWRLGIFVILILIAVMNGCNSAGPIGRPPDTYSYRINGVLVNNLNADLIMGDTARISVLVERNDTILGTAMVTFGTTILVFDRPTFAFDSVYSFALGPTSLVEAGAYGLGLVDSIRFGDTLIMVVPDTFRIDYYVGAEDSVNVGGQEMQVGWFSGANVEGYVLAVVLEDSVNTGWGYSEYVTSQAPLTTIPPDAFRLESGIGGLPDTGWYHIFIYGYTGHPDSSFSAPLLPVPLPSDLGDNVDEEDLTGKTGTVSVTRHVRVHVVAQ
ncbi:MAG: hypothetical protein JSV52_14200 [Candidatus Zixiibacteriota bacterium]|nr:MAG: hypothetical protein JSV52_14200 [candidate division Zixibacteria bacterium]